MWLRILHIKVMFCISDKYNTNQELYDSRVKMMQILLEVGLEPTTLGLLDPHSDQLSYTSYCDLMPTTDCSRFTNISISEEIDKTSF
jgi:hypothetical protein